MTHSGVVKHGYSHQFGRNTALFTHDDLLSLNARFEHTNPQHILQWAADRFGEAAAVVTSLQPTGIVTLHMMHTLGIRLPVLTLDTGHLFPETYTLIEQVEAHFNITVERIKPDVHVIEQDQSGTPLWQHDTNQCCYLHKVLPLKKALAPYDAWITGLRRDQSPSRAETDIVSWDAQRNMTKLCPLATWTEAMVWSYIKGYQLPYNTLHDKGYPSIGCMPCTQPVNGTRDLRAGRWQGTNKTECGIHL